MLRAIKNDNDISLLQNDIVSLTKFCKLNMLKLNKQKCKHLRFCLKRDVNLITYSIDDFSIEQIDFHKHLGIIYDKKLTFNMHVDQIITKAFNKFYILKNIFTKINGFLFLKLYFTYVLPILEFSNLCYIVVSSSFCFFFKFRAAHALL